MTGSRGYRSADTLERTFAFVEINQETFDGWTEYTITHDLLHGTSSFHMSAPAFPRDDEGRGDQLVDLDARGIKRGQRIKVYVKTPKARNPVLVLTGIIDDVDIEESREGANVQISGRCHMAPIVDSDAPPRIGLENVTLGEAAMRMLTEVSPGQSTPFFKWTDILIDNDANRALSTGNAAAGTTLSASAPKKLETYKIDQIKPHPGETIFAFLSRHAQRFGLLVWGTADGKIVFGKPNYDQLPMYDLRLRQGARGAENNVKHFRRRTSFKQRPSEIHVYGHSTGRDHLSSSIHAVARDQEVLDAGLFRQLTIHDNNARTKEQAECRANFELSTRRQTGDVLHATVAGHAADEDGTVYAIDTIASVAWDKAGLNEGRYVVSRTFTRSRSAGTHTQLQLVPKGSIALGTGGQ